MREPAREEKLGPGYGDGAEERVVDLLSGTHM
jgi:hypothetical protein